MRLTKNRKRRRRCMAFIIALAVFGCLQSVDKERPVRTVLVLPWRRCCAETRKHAGCPLLEELAAEQVQRRIRREDADALTVAGELDPAGFHPGWRRQANEDQARLRAFRAGVASNGNRVIAMSARLRALGHGSCDWFANGGVLP